MNEYPSDSENHDEYRHFSGMYREDTRNHWEEYRKDIEKTQTLD